MAAPIKYIETETTNQKPSGNERNESTPTVKTPVFIPPGQRNRRRHHRKATFCDDGVINWKVTVAIIMSITLNRCWSRVVGMGSFKYAFICGKSLRPFRNICCSPYLCL